MLMIADFIVFIRDSLNVFDLVSNQKSFLTSISVMVVCSPMGWEIGGSIPDRVFPKTQIMVLNASLLNAKHYKV